MERKDITSSAKVLAWRLADHHNQHTGRCNPSLQALVRGTGISRSVVHANLTALRDAGLIEWTSGNSMGSNSYVLKGVAIHDPKAKLASPIPERGKAPILWLVPKDDASASETVRSTGLPPSDQSDYPPSGQSDPNTPILTPEGTLSPSTPSEDTASPLSPEGHRGETNGTHTIQPKTKVEPQIKPRATAWPDDMVWSRPIAEMAEDHYRGFSRGEIKVTFDNFRDHAQSRGLKYADWHKAWMDYFKGAIRIRNENRKPSRSAPAI